MYRSFVVAAVAALIGRTVAQTAYFVNVTWGPVTVGSLWPIAWSEGNGQPVTLHLSNATWDYTVFENKAVTPGMYDWTVSVPDGFAEGNYQLNLMQTGGGISSSPVFAVSFSTLPPMTMTMSSSADHSVSQTLGTTMTTSATPNATVIVSPTITVVCPVVWYEEECGCNKTSTMPVVMPTPTATEYVFHDDNCGCSKTAVIPTATALPTCPGADGCSNYTAPMTTPEWMPPAAAPTQSGPAGYTGAASNFKLSGSRIAAIVFAAGALAL